MSSSRKGVPASQEALDTFVTTQILDNGMDVIANKINLLREKLLQSGRNEVDAQTKKRWAKRLQHWLALACRLLATQRQQLHHCIERVEHDYSRGEVGLGTGKIEVKEEEETNLYSRTYTRLRGASSSSVQASIDSDSYANAFIPDMKDIPREGCHVAAKVARSHELWIMARVVKYNADSRTYEVEDVDCGDEDGEDDAVKRHYIVAWQHVVELPGDSLSEGEWIQYSLNERVMAMYPNTTSFFRSTIRVPNPKGAPYVILKFDEDEDEHGLVPDRKVPFRFVAPLKPWHQM
ncbi:Histone acetyltransferase SAGA associated factor SGF29 [Plasmopara halstedii]|uniref:Histone acetyltransferase SAGA associated factor SGF29 n=1 Tax=Plasmopara halstedii TaxID=4781 RepID=A0A0P1ARG5_PLAHL|nr:Histone acetyltransferase SAGA associated factor SGF29 [Plasmopara halstedii]CEG43929.1 Histone acetyltransferase SAGA associated factor SGF29 [Plasmopara halstedii]|eukprot:XP_024580298.1 Histone acetyltransferase SAGA associated factor SGF29 [Plasmopara halstedii]